MPRGGGEWSEGMGDTLPSWTDLELKMDGGRSLTKGATSGSGIR